ncbi:hypothetical protein C462_16336 [Halorubrum distributum JCM 13916]|uniref:Uncharacterized protein n=1 Tax=Halorubrum distributum JCM 13916 TaxID=1230455 RepID=M0P8N7_9EURY|nr:hypothetical protein C462_16336 [Halorubrum arcis JCM 13916]
MTYRLLKNLLPLRCSRQQTSILMTTLSCIFQKSACICYRSTPVVLLMLLGEVSRIIGQEKWEKTPSPSHLVHGDQSILKSTRMVETGESISIITGQPSM